MEIIKALFCRETVLSEINAVMDLSILCIECRFGNSFMQQ